LTSSDDFPRPVWLRYGLAVAGTAAVFVITRVFWPTFEHIPSALFLLVVFGSGWLGGVGPSLVATLLGAVASESLIHSAIGATRWLDPRAVPRILIFLAVGSAVSAITGQYWVARRDRRRAAEGLRRSEAHFRTIVQTANEGICLVDRQGNTVYVNERMGEILGTPADDLLRRPVMDFVPPEYHETARSRVRANFAGRSEEFEFPVLRADGTTAWMRIGSSPMRDADGQIVGALGMFSDLTERSRAEQSLRESEERYRTLTEAVHQMMWINEPAGATTYVNREWQEYVGREPDADGRVDWNELVLPEDIPRVHALRRSAIESGEPYQAEYRIRRHDGQFRWFLSRVVPMKDERGGVLSWFGAAADIHDLKTAEEELRRAKEDAEAASRAKDDFLAALSHELRTPLTPVLAISSRLERSPSLPQAARSGFELIRRNVELEARLIDDLLDLTRITKGRIEIEQEPVDVHEALQDVLDICSPDASARELGVEARLRAGQCWVRGDPARLRQVFWNLLNNAIKFTPERGRILLETLEGDGAERLLVRVTDTGVGIDPSHFDRIFRPFEQPGSVRGHRGAGLGLGLAITSSLVQAHGGTLAAASEGPGKGSTFTVELATIPTPARSAVRRAPPASRSGEPGSRRILLVEDHEETLRAASEILIEDAYVVRTAATVQEALEAAAREPFDLVISDIGLPDGSGLDLMERLRREHGVRGIAITGYGMREDVERSRKAGFLEHLVKPITAQKLESAVERALGSDPAGEG
jgi:PAS domain S-box-containing protein